MTVLTVAFLLPGLTAEPARADSAAPTHYQSEVTRVEPQPVGVSFQVVGGDAFLQVSAEPGHTVAVPGYFDEAYVRIDADGSVWVNEASPAFYINQDRYGQTRVPEGITADNPPTWALVGDDGTYAWHDHRVHWMSYDRPPTVRGDVEQTVFPWPKLPVVVDGVETSVSGVLVWVPSRSPIPALLAGIVALLPLLVWGARSKASMVVMLGTGAILASVIAIAQIAATPAAAHSISFGALLGVIVLGLVVAFLVLARPRPSRALWAGFLGGALLLVWGWMTAPTMWMPELVSSLSPVVERWGVAAVIWSGLGVAAMTGTAILDSARR